MALVRASQRRVLSLLQSRSHSLVRGSPAKAWRVGISTDSCTASRTLGMRVLTSTGRATSGVRRTTRRIGWVIGVGASSRALEGGQRLLGRVADAEEGVELGQLEERPEILVQP